MMSQRDPIITALLTFLTLNLYFYYFLYKLNTEIRQNTGKPIRLWLRMAPVPLLLIGLVLPVPIKDVFLSIGGVGLLASMGAARGDVEAELKKKFPPKEETGLVRQLKKWAIPLVLLALFFACALSVWLQQGWILLIVFAPFIIFFLLLPQIYTFIVQRDENRLGWESHYL